jgi:hypothetical protein
VSAQPLHDEVARLEAEVRRADEALSHARYAAERTRNEKHLALTADLAKYRDSLLFDHSKQPDFDEQRELTRRFCERLLADGLTLEVRGSGGAISLSVTDPAIDIELEAARTAHTEARAAVRRFRTENAEGLAKEADRSRMEKLRDALKGDDPEAVRRALGGADATPAPAQPTRARVTRPAFA